MIEDHFGKIILIAIGLIIAVIVHVYNYNKNIKNHEIKYIKNWRYKDDEKRKADNRNRKVK